MERHQLAQAFTTGQGERAGSYIETIELWDAILSDELRDRRVALRHPPEELWDAHSEDMVAVAGGWSSL